eukprot:TRINITY_DN31186_c0_g2_i1.p1 TRINITY_DN31186_c0_g2~~TRINITY_DN31186_c0_g2_i1.p1  ORF type:complete len:1211 (-),score=199.81 TRINITY_DN31186_c0_g2_i1:145-3777(-)
MGRQAALRRTGCFRQRLGRKHVASYTLLGLAGFLVCAVSVYASHAGSARILSTLLRRQELDQQLTEAAEGLLKLHATTTTTTTLPAEEEEEEEVRTKSVLRGTISVWQRIWRKYVFNPEEDTEKILPKPVAELLKSAQLSEWERERLRRQQEDYYHDDSLRKVMVTLALNVPAFVILLIGYELLLRDWPWRGGRELVVPRLVLDELTSSAISGSADTDVLHFPRRPPDPESHYSRSPSAKPRRRCRLLQLLRVVLTADETLLVECAGLDGVVVLRFCAMCGRFCVLSCVWCLILAALYARGSNWWITGPKQELSRFSLSNLRQGSPMLSAVVPAAYAFTATLCGLLWKEYEHFVMLRRHFLGGRRAYKIAKGRSHDTKGGYLGISDQTRRTVVVERLPDDLRSPDALRSFFEKLLGAGTVHSVAPVPADSTELSWMLEERERLWNLSRRPFAGSSAKADLATLDRRLRKRREEFFEAMRDNGAARSEAAWEAQVSMNNPAVVNGGLGSRNVCDRSLYYSLSAGSTGHGTLQMVRTVPEQGGLERDRQGLTPLCLPPALAAINLSPSIQPSMNPSINPSRQQSATGTPSAMRSRCGSWDSLPDIPTTTSLQPSLGSSWRGHSGSFDASPVEPTWSRCGRRLRRLFRGPYLVRELWAAFWLCVRAAWDAVVYAVSAVSAVAAEMAGTSAEQVGHLVPRHTLGGVGGNRGDWSPLSEEFSDTDWEKSDKSDSSAIATPPLPRRLQSYSMLDAVDRVSCSSTAFITFRSLRAASVACQVVLDEDAFVGSKVTARPAPGPRDILWHNTAVPWIRTKIRRYFINVALIFGIIFWSVPVTFLQAWTSMARLRRLLPEWAQPPVTWESSYVGALCTLYAPVLVLLGLLDLMPYALHALAARYEGVKTTSALRMLTMRRYWWFQLATIHVTALSGSLSDALVGILEHPASVLWQLGQAVPGVAVYFLVYALSSALLLTPLTLLRPSELLRRVWYCLLRCFCCKQRTPLVEEQLPSPDLESDLFTLILVLLICVAYATIAPLIMFAGLLLFVIRRQVLAVRYLYVEVPRFDSGGAHWYLLWDQAMGAMFFAHATTIAVVALRGGYVQLPFLLALPVLTYAFKKRAEDRFFRPSRQLSLSAARVMDHYAGTRVADSFKADAFCHPALRRTLPGLGLAADGRSVSESATKLRDEQRKKAQQEKSPAPQAYPPDARMPRFRSL